MPNPPAKILITDDDETMREILTATLERAGFEIRTAIHGLDAQARLKETQFDVAIVDLSMPVCDGFELLEWLRAHKPGVVPVVLSATSDVKEALRAVHEGAYDFVPKPVSDPDVFVQHIKRAIEHKRLQDGHNRLLRELHDTNVELANRLGQLEMAYDLLQSQALAIQVDLNRAKAIQRGLLPKNLPFSDRVSAAAVYEPMAKVGGDLYDLFQLDDHRLGLYIADASGHGVSSAILTVFLKYAVDQTVRLTSNGQGTDPGRVLDALNETVLSERFSQGVFVSMIYAVLDVTTSAVRFSSAGHPPMLLRRADGQVERVRQPGPVLGVNPHVEYTVAEFALNQGDALVLYTDGITEARNPAGEFYEAQRLTKAIAAAQNRADAVAAAVQQDVTSFRDGRPNADDATLLVLAAQPQRTPFYAPSKEDEAPGATKQAAAKILTATHDRCLFISVFGAGSWRESQQVLDLCNRAREAGESAVIMDLATCTHLDSTFLGVLHNIASSFDDQSPCRFEIQNVPRVLLRNMSELGLTAVLMHFRHEPAPLPEWMRPVEGAIPGGEEMGRLLLWAHESLVHADPKNADRFAAVLKVLHDQVTGGKRQAGAQAARDPS